MFQSLYLGIFINTYMLIYKVSTKKQHIYLYCIGTLIRHSWVHYTVCWFVIQYISGLIGFTFVNIWFQGSAVHSSSFLFVYCQSTGKSQKRTKKAVYGKYREIFWVNLSTSEDIYCTKLYTLKVDFRSKSNIFTYSCVLHSHKVFMKYI